MSDFHFNRLRPATIVEYRYRVSVGGLTAFGQKTFTAKKLLSAPPFHCRQSTITTLHNQK